MKIFSGGSNKSLTEKIAKKLGFSLSSLEIHTFPDKEKRVRVLDSVVNVDCVVVQSTGMPVDENYFELLLIIDALKRSGAKSVTAVVPYLGYARQDHVFRSGEARSFAVIARMIEVVGVDKLVTFDLHSIKIPELFKIPVAHLSALPLFAEKIRKIEVSSDVVLVSPDMGGIRRVEQLSRMLGDLPTATIEKKRDLETGKITSESIKGMLRERAIIVDDMISTGATIVQAAELLTNNGVEEMIVFATHPVFVSDAPRLLERSDIEVVYVTDTIEVPKEKQFPKLEILSVVDMVAKELFKA